MAELRWHGHTCFRLRVREAAIILDPVERSSGYGMGRHNAEIVTFSGDPLGTNEGAIRTEFKAVRGPGEYEMNDVFITGARTYQDKDRGAERGYNTMYLIEAEGLKIGHLGNLGHPLTESQAEPLEGVDILLAPTGGETGLTYDEAVDTITKLEPKLLIPMRYRTVLGGTNDGDLETFLRKLGVEAPEPVDKLTVRKSDLGETIQVVVLNPDSDPVKR